MADGYGLGQCDYDEFPPAVMADNNDGFEQLTSLYGATNPLAAIRPAYRGYIKGDPTEEPARSSRVVCQD